jgi:hypothetical protein
MTLIMIESEVLHKSATFEIHKHKINSAYTSESEWGRRAAEVVGSRWSLLIVGGGNTSDDALPTKETPGAWWRDMFFSGRAAAEYN